MPAERRTIAWLRYWNVRYWHLADMETALLNVCFRGQSGRFFVQPNVSANDPKRTFKHAMNLMTRHRVRHLPVVDDGKLVGIVSIGDIIKRRVDDLEMESNVLRDVYIAAR